MSNLKIIEQKDQRVITTAQLAESYGTDYKTISKNFSRNKNRYQEGKHFILLQGDERKEFLVNYHQIDDSSKHAKHIYLWTAKGALLHAKSLGTDKAWEAYEALVDDYFNKTEQLQRAHIPSPVPQTLEDIMIAQLVSMKELKAENEKLRQDVSHLSLVVDNEIWITDHQKAEIQEAVNNRVGKLMAKGYEAHFQSIYRALKDHFSVPKYDKIKRVDFDRAIDLIKGWYPKKKEDNAG